MAKTKMLRSGSRLAGIALGILSLVSPSAGSSAEKKGDEAVKPKVDEGLGAILVEHQLSELIITQGEGKIVTKPDSMRAELGVEVQAKTLELAQRQLARKMESVTKAIEKLGLPGLVLQTETLRIDPIETEPKPGTAAKIVGYRAQNTLSITLRGVEPAELGAKAATIVDAGVGAGANVVEGISFFLARPEEAQAKALHMAALDAERNAQILAASAGVKLGALHQMEGNPERASTYALRAGAALKAATTIEPGEVSVSARVSARYHFSKQ